MAESSATSAGKEELASAVASEVETQSNGCWSRPQFQSGVASPMHVDLFCPVVFIRDAYRCE